LAAVNNMNNGAIVSVAANQFHGRAGVLHGQAAAVNTITDIENLINSKIPVTMARSSAVPVPSSSPFSSPQNDTSFQRLFALAYKLRLPRDIDISKVTLSDLEIFINTELNKNLPFDHIYRGNQVFGMSSGTRKPKKSKKCSSCKKPGHIKSSCPKSKKGRRKTNYAHNSSDSFNVSDSSDSSHSSDSDSNSGHACYRLKKKPTERKCVDKKSTDKKKSQLERQRIIFE
ncbi:23132_t:CDS:2, partial [Rhizophagus irregularis]